MAVIIIDGDNREYTSFISQTLNRLKQYDVKALAIVAQTAKMIQLQLNGTWR